MISALPLLTMKSINCFLSLILIGQSLPAIAGTKTSFKGSDFAECCEKQNGTIQITGPQDSCTYLTPDGQSLSFDPAQNYLGRERRLQRGIRPGFASAYVPICAPQIPADFLDDWTPRALHQQTKPQFPNSTFILEELKSTEDIQKWLIYTRQQFTRIQEAKDLFSFKDRKLLTSAQDPLTMFRRCLIIQSIHTPPPRMYVAYVLSPPLQNPSGKWDTSDIEMSMCVMTRDSMPVVTHMGVTRAPLHIKSRGTQNPNLSVALHQFTAQALLRQSGEMMPKQWMITTPLPPMREILKKELPQGSWFEGVRTPTQWTPISQRFVTKPHARSILFDIQDPRQESIYFFETPDSEEEAKTDRWFKSLNEVKSSSVPYFSVFYPTLAEL